MEVGQHIWMIGPAGDNLVEEGTTTCQRVQPHVLLFFLSDQQPPHLAHYTSLARPRKGEAWQSTEELVWLDNQGPPPA